MPNLLTVSRSLAPLALLLTLLGCAPANGNGDSSDTGTCNSANENCTANTCDGEGGSMLPGSDCLSCHSGNGGGGGEQSTFTAAGTAFSDLAGTAPLSGATVKITDASGNVVTLTTNSAGNFYTSQALTFPIGAEVDANGGSRTMVTAVAAGGCNGCHTCTGPSGGKLTSP